MHRTCKRILAVVMAAVFLAGSLNISPDTGYVRAAAVQEKKDELTSEKTAEEAGKNTSEGREAPGVKETSEKPEQDEKNASDKPSEETGGTEKEKDEDKDKDKPASPEADTGEDRPGRDTEEGQETGPSQAETDPERSSEGSGPAVTEEESDPKDAEEGTGAETPEEDTDVEEAEEEVLRDPSDEDQEPSPRPGTGLKSASGPHDVDMPDVTSHYFRLQKQSRKVSSASGSNLKVVEDVNAASRYISTEMKDGNLYSFTPRMTSSTTVTVGGGSGGRVSLDTVRASDRNRFGNLYETTNIGHIQTCVFDLSKCSSNPYAVYTNVGTWHDPSTRKTYSVDMRMTVTGYLFPSEKIRNQLHNQYVAPYVGFSTNHIGVTAMGTDYVQTDMTFYYHGTEDRITNLKGLIQFCDVDAQQGVDFGNGFEKIIMFNTSASHLQYNSTGLISNSLGYVSSRTGENIDTGDANTTVLGVFSGSGVTCRWTLAKCDHEDTGGTAAYREASGYGIPADSSQEEAISYYWSNSTGFLGVYTDVGLITLPPEVDKRIYKGDTDPSGSTTGLREVSLADRDGKCTFVLTGSAALPSDIELAKYTEFTFTDTLEAAFSIKKDEVKVYTEKSLQDSQDTFADVTDQFAVTVTDQDDHRTGITLEAKAEALAQASFYGRTYYVHLPVRIRTEEELGEFGMSLSDWYQKDNSLGEEIGSSKSYVGVVAMGNSAELYAASNQGNNTTLTSPSTGVRLSMRVLIRKFGDSSDTPAEGVTFALYGGEPGDDPEGEPLMTAVTDKDGFACFAPSSDTFFNKEYGDGPYYIRELSVPEEYREIWSPAVNEKWSSLIPSLTDLLLLEKESVLAEKLDKQDKEVSDRILWNTPKENPENSVKVYKQSSDTEEFLSGAEFELQEWSKKEEKYLKLMTLTPGTDDDGNPYYYNGDSFMNTMDNLGRYRVVETKAPAGCLLNQEPRTFTMGEETKEFSHTFVNDLQKVRLTLEKKGDDGALLPDVTFRIKAAEDIYAPWASDGKDDKASALLTAKGTVVDTIVTDGEGTAVSTEGHELYVGEYLVEETEGAEGYLISSEPHRISLDYSSEIKDPVILYQTTLTNQKMKPAMAVAKLADRTLNREGQAVKMNKETGRYVQEKIAGGYSAGENVDFTITVTNTGNTDLYNLKLLESMDTINEDQGYALKDFVREDSIRYEIPKEGYLLSSRGNRVKGTPDKEDPLVFVLDHLAAEDSVDVHFVVRLTDKAANIYDLENNVKLFAEYNVRQGEETEPEYLEVPADDLVDEEGRPLTEDQDMINIPGIPGMKVAKIADKTTGAALKAGRYEGEKKAGVYEYGENVDYTITVTNSGTADLYQIRVEDLPSDKLADVLAKDSLSFPEGTYPTALGQEVHAVSIDGEEGSNALLLDYLMPGDSVELHLKAKIRSGSPAGKNLKNTVKVSAEYQTGREAFRSIPRTPEMEDSDTLVVGVPRLTVAKLADRTKGVTLKKGRYEGKKKTAAYTAGDTVLFTLTVSNTGKGTARDIIVTELPSSGLLDYVTPVGYQQKEGESLNTTKNNSVTVTEAGRDQLKLDRLLPGDSVELIYECKVMDEIEKASKLVNEAKVKGFNTDGSSIPGTEEMKDRDSIDLKKTKAPAVSIPGYPGSYPKTGDNTYPARQLAIAGLALLGIILTIRKKSEKRS